MALSRIWAAFFIVSILMACYQWLIKGDTEVFNRMINFDKADTKYFLIQGEPTTLQPSRQDISSRDKFVAYLKDYKYELAGADSIKIRKAKYIISDAPNALYVDSMQRINPSIRIVSYAATQIRLRREVDGVILTCKNAVLEVGFGLIGLITLFLGFMTIAEKAGGIRFLSRLIGPFFSRIFPELPKGHPAMGHMMMNFSANMLGLDNAATPFGIKAMESLQELNPDKDRASNAQIMFLCLHASGLTLIPVSIIALRSSTAGGAANPTDVFLPILISTFTATIAAMLIVSIRQRINVFQPVILGWIGGISALIAGLVVYLKTLDSTQVTLFSNVLSSGLLLTIFLSILIGGLYKKIDLFGTFIEGAKEGFGTAVRIIPYLVGMLVSISLLRTSGVFDIVLDALKSLVGMFGSDTLFVDGLPTALIKPLSGSGARGMMVDTMKTLGPDSFGGRLACILQGSSDTTLYVIAVYFGAVSVRNTRYTLGAMLLADLVGIVTSILLCYLFFT